MSRLFFLMGLMLSHGSLWAINCYFTLVKDNCWANYSITVDITDSISEQRLATVSIPKGKQWARQIFSCQPNQKLMYTAQFTPVFWQSDIGKIYSAKNYKSLPIAMKPNETAWTLTSCFPADYSSVPMPPEATNSCQCDFNSIPPIELPPAT